MSRSLPAERGQPGAFVHWYVLRGPMPGRGMPGEIMPSAPMTADRWTWGNGTMQASRSRSEPGPRLGEAVEGKPAMETLTGPILPLRSSSGRGRAPESRTERVARLLAYSSLVLVAIKPLLDIGESSAAAGLDVGVVSSALGAVLMTSAYGLILADSRQLPPSALLVALAAVLAMLVMSCLSYVLVPVRSDLLAMFNVRRYAIYGPHLEPASAIPTEAMRLIVGFAPIALLGLVLARRSWFSVHRLSVVMYILMAGAAVHCVLAWLQVADVIPYSFYFELPGQEIGRASGGYYHPMSLGRLLIFSVFLLYLFGNRPGWRSGLRYALVGIFVATGLISLHRFTIICLIVVVVVFETRRMGAMRGWMRSRRAGILVGAGAIVVVGLVTALWGGAIWNRSVTALTVVGSLNVHDDTFMHGRGAIWNDLAGILGKSPLDVWLLGFGYEPWDMHNDLLRLLVIWGLVGVASSAVMLWVIYRCVRACTSATARRPLILLYSVVVLFGLTQKPLGYPYFLWLFFLSQMFIMALAPPRLAVEKSAEVVPAV